VQNVGEKLAEFG